MPRLRDLFRTDPRVAYTPRNLIQAPEISRKLARAFNLKEPAAAPTLAPEVMPVVVIANIAESQAEDFEVERPYHDGLVLTGLVTDIAHTWHLGAPPGTLIVVEQVLVTATVNTDSALFFGAAPNPPVGSTLGAPKTRHSGIQPILSSAAVFAAKQNQLASVGITPSGFTARKYIAPRDSKEYTGPWFITPGHALRVGMSGLIAGEFTVSFFWRERRIDA